MNLLYDLPEDVRVLVVKELLMTFRRSNRLLLGDKGFYGWYACGDE